MLKRKSVLKGLGVAIAMAIPLSAFTAIPASAVASCETSMAPNHASSLAGIKVGCIVDVTALASGNASRIDVHDGTNAIWRRGAARTVPTIGTTNASPNITFVGTDLTASDVSRPISGTGIGATAYIRSVGAGTAVLSVNSTATGSTTATVEHTTSRVLANASNTAGASSTLTAVGANFVTADILKSVSGGAFPPGARITAIVGAQPSNSATVSSPAVVPAAHAAADDMITIGAVKYTTAVLTNLATTYTETFTREMKRVPAPGTAQCTASNLTITAAGGGTNAADDELKVQFFLANGSAVAGSWKVNSVTNATTLALSAACPAAAWTNVVIGEPGANAPKNVAPMAALTAALNLNPTLNATSDDCNKNTYEGFQVIGAWNNPGSFAIAGVLGAPPDRSVGQVAFLTSVVSFAGYVVPKTVAEVPATGQAVPHYDFTFPTLPTSLAVCPIVAGTTTTKTMVNLGFWATTLTTSPFLPTGSGNPSAPSVRQIGPATGLFGQKVSLFNSTGGAIGAVLAPPGCTVIARTITPTFANDCGLG